MKLHPPSMRHRRAITDGTQLREFAAACIEQHTSDGHMDVLLAAEQSERTALKAFGRKFSNRRTQ